MDSLLRWGIENSAPPLPGAPPAVVRNDLDPAIIDHILGKPDAVLMKEALAVAVDETKGEDERMEALDNLEMVRLVFPVVLKGLNSAALQLVENIDNANGKPIYLVIESRRCLGCRENTRLRYTAL